MNAGVVVARLVVQQDVALGVKLTSQFHLRKRGRGLHLLCAWRDQHRCLRPLREPRLFVVCPLLLPKTQLDACHYATDGDQMGQHSTHHGGEGDCHHAKPLY